MAKRESIKRASVSKVTSIIAITGLIGALFFIGSNITGNVIGTVPGTDIIGMIFLTVGLFGAYMLVKGHQKTLKKK